MPDGANLAKTLKVPFFETSAKQRTNIDSAFFELVRSVRKAKPALANGAAAGNSITARSQQELPPKVHSALSQVVLTK